MPLTISWHEVAVWVLFVERVEDLTGGQQHPTTAKPNSIRDFPIGGTVSIGAKGARS